MQQEILKNNFRFIAQKWLEDKKQYVKSSTVMVYYFVIDKHLNPVFGEQTNILESQAQTFILNKVKIGLKVKTVESVMIVLKMILKFGVKHYR
ncbi:hypothetical protein [Candidatus Phytoplasma luffae]|uniref:hypothetical protein n=1 Tax=Loofah witches'-broom phytoplasma TaxID=35773 RepID=UPI001B392569|nr:hypothetical protein [Candidatus Phytoplasma luffae]